MDGLIGLVIAAGVVAAATAVGVWYRRRGGRVCPAPAEPAAGLLGSLGVEADGHLTLLQFSSAFCAPCRATRVTCGQIAASHDRVRYLEVDAESNLDAVRALRVWRTPTVFVVDPAGRLVTRVTGQPTRAQLTEVIAKAARGVNDVSGLGAGSGRRRQRPGGTP